MQTEADVYPIAWNEARVFRKNPVLALTVALLITPEIGCWSDAQRPPAAPPPAARPAPAQPAEVAAAEFGTVNEDGVVTPATEIPLYDGSLFGWRIKIPGCEPLIEVREELTLPGPGDWERGEGMTISRDQQTAIVRSDAECHDGWVAKIWSVAAGDPPGDWVLRVTVKGYAPLTFAAAVNPPPAPPTP